jgi:hypothetical protein
MTFARIPTPSDDIMTDAWTKSADFSMENDVLTEASLHLLGSDCPEHHVKGISVHLRGELQELETDQSAMQQFIAETKSKLAAIHNVSPSEIVVVGLRQGSIKVSYGLPRDSQELLNLESQYRQQFGPQYLQCDIHPSFSQLNINPDTFDVRWNRDFGQPSQCPQGECRGGQPYNPPAGFIRFGLKVAGRFDYGDDTWLGMSNVPGEWCVAYHGTKGGSVKSITESPLQTGPNNAYGRGIYCSPDPATAAGYTDQITMTTNQGTKQLRYMFMCRVNPRSIHHCTQCPCPEAQSPNYSVHFTTQNGIWFVNCQNQAYQHIRPYGLLVRVE